jgi:putative DNA primase/helicase
MNLETVLARLQGVRRSGRRWMALCPAHEDKNPSLSVREENGTLLLHCFAGCALETICASMRIEMSELFSDDGPAPRIVAEYDYLDADGKVLFQVVRFEPKDFRQRRPGGKDSWHWNLNGVRRVLYRLPEVLAAKFVLGCEGEKDCETARALGIVATCNPGGAGKWREEYSKSLHGKRFTIIADSDEPGRKHAQQVAVSLYGKVESLQVLELTGAKDLTEWVERGGISAEPFAALLS